MSFHSVLIADAVWPADIRTALSLTDGASVYTGRRPRKIKQGTEVWLERLETLDRALGAGHQVKEHQYRVHVMTHNKPDGDLTGDAQLTTVEAHLETLVDRYNGDRHFTGTIADLISMKVEEESVDEDPDENGMLSGTVRVSFFER